MAPIAPTEPRRRFGRGEEAGDADQASRGDGAARRREHQGQSVEEVVRIGTPQPLAAPVAPPEPHQVRLVVVTTHPAPDAGSGATPMLVARYWHPREGRWIELQVESAEHAVRLFVDENGWLLRQQQVLDTPDHHELIFETKTERLDLPSAAEVLEEEVGLAPADVEEILQRVEEHSDPSSGTG